MATAVQTLDVRPLAPRDKHPSIFRLFDAMASGEVLHIVNDHDPIPLFYQFQMERPGIFTWEKKEDGPDVWQVDITKINPAKSA